MKYVYRDGIVYYNGEKLMLNWSDEEKPFLQDMKTGRKKHIEMHSISKFSWIQSKTRFTLKIDRTSRRPAKEKVWDRYRFVEVEECDCTISTEKII